MLMLTTDALPPGMELVETFGLITTTYPVQISQKGLFQAIADRKRNEQQEAIQLFINAAPLGTNVIYGVKISTSTAIFSNGSFLYITYFGTAGKCKSV